MPATRMPAWAESSGIAEEQLGCSAGLHEELPPGAPLLTGCATPRARDQGYRARRQHSSTARKQIVGHANGGCRSSPATIAPCPACRNRTATPSTPPRQLCVTQARPAAGRACVREVHEGWERRLAAAAAAARLKPLPADARGSQWRPGCCRPTAAPAPGTQRPPPCPSASCTHPQTSRSCTPPSCGPWGPAAP